jgi:aminocarboxymuconate-semialdehyde decarboxylase
VSEPGIIHGHVDIHAHHFSAALPDFAGRTGDERWPHLETNGSSGRILLGQRLFRTVPSSLWDLSARLAELDAAGVAVQLISPVPIELTYWADVAPASEFMRAINDSIAGEVAASAGRLRGLGAVPLQNSEAAIEEVRRVGTELQLDGIEIGTHAAGRELDDPDLDPFWAAVADLDLAVFVHPLDGGGGAIRRPGQPYDFGLGMLTDTALAAIALLNGGVLDRYPNLRVVLAHGCGTFAWAFPRLRVGSTLTATPDIAERYAELARRLWVDSLVLDPEHMRLLARRFGADHVMLGSDFPFMPGQLASAAQFVAEAAELGAFSADAAQAVLGANALAFLQRK